MKAKAKAPRKGYIQAGETKKGTIDSPMILLGLNLEMQVVQIKDQK